ncbi:ATP synthase F1, delta subunit [gut metagenome]|uniref:ATP synthase F1, delta subunit n=1 Tax=gut metagenome TaxID=749906 RepID=J9F6Z7_9ZZZZ
MDIGIVSMRYAKALMAYAKDTRTEESLYIAMKTLMRSFKRQPELVNVLENPILPRREKYKLVCVAAMGNDSPSREFSRFVTLVLKNGREGMLRYICLCFLDLYRKSKHIGVGRLITAVPVSSEVEERIRKSAASLLHARMELRTEVDASIGGGFVFDINDYRLDASITTQLKRVKEQFIVKNRRIV